VTYDARTKRYAREQEDRIAVLDKVRLYRNGGGRNRDDLDRDYARILYSSSFRRLQGKMQLLGIDQLYFYRNRLTHSMEVAQIARAIASDLGLNKTIVAESCSLAHDLGNPPFGHYGETVLNRLASEIGGFEGNAQTFRILSRLEKRHYEYGGLNLTLRTLFGVVKYYFRRERDDQDKFLYDEDYQLVSDKLKKYKLGDEVNTIDKQIMDKADEIAYGAHDLEDSLSLGYFTIDELLYEFRCDSRFREAHDTLDRIVNDCREFAYRAHRLDTSEEFSFLFRKELTSNIVNTLVKDIHYPKGGDKLTFNEHSVLAKGLKKLTFKAVLRRPAVQLYEKRGGRILEGLYNVYTDEEFNKELMLLPPEFRQGHEDSHKRKRNVIDYIAGMMDAFALQEYQKYYGSGNLERLYMPEDSKKP
jgi:dGTPase